MKRFTTRKQFIELKLALGRLERTDGAKCPVENALDTLHLVVVGDLQEFREQLLSYVHAQCSTFEAALKAENEACKNILEHEYDVIKQLDDQVSRQYDLEHAFVNEIISEGEFIRVIVQYPNLAQAILGQALESYFRP